MINIEELYEKEVSSKSDNFIRVVIDDEYLKKINEFAEELAKAKEKEKHHVIDNNKSIKRFVTGLIGEAALEKLFGVDIIEWSIGDSNTYNHPDIPGFKVGIKTVEKGKFPVIFKKNYYPQIICIKSDKFDNLVFVCGLATKKVLDEFQSDELILDKNLRARGTKTGFYGFDKLIKINSLDDLKEYEKL